MVGSYFNTRREKLPLGNAILQVMTTQKAIENLWLGHQAEFLPLKIPQIGKLNL